MTTAIVGIGASSGGLEALSELLEAMPGRPGAAIVVVQHLDLSHESFLVDILGRKTRLPVVEAKDGLAIRENYVYAIPPDVTPTVASGSLRLTPRAPGREPHMPVDALFRSMAVEYSERAVGVVLSGAGSDGARGILEIKQAGGITFAQDPASARIPSMPGSAVETGGVDFVLRPAQIARELQRLASHRYLPSANDELRATNEELRDRNRQLAVLNAELERARASSERARAYADGIVETIREPLVVLNGSMRILRVNKAFCTEFDVRSGEIEGCLLESVCGGLWDGPLREKLAAVLEHGQAVSDFEVELNRARKRILSLSARRIAGDAERGELILLAIEDITERRARTDLLCEDCRRKDEFLAVLAHELRSPLGIVTYAVHLLKRTEGDEAAELRELLARQTLRLVRIVDDLLDVARISRGLIGLKRVPLDLVPLVRNVASACDGRLRECGHMLSVSVPEGPVCIDGDAVRIEQVVSNLLENAIKYTDPGGRIALTLSEADGAATISVADNGIGLAPESLERIFELFAQVKSSRARSKGGLGLGLSVAHRVLEMHGGWIEARSAGLGQGSEFIARIPLLPAHKAPGGQEAAEQDSRAAREAGFDEQVVKTVPPEWLASLIAKGR